MKIKIALFVLLVTTTFSLEIFGQPSSSRVPDKNNGLTAAETAEANRRREKDIFAGQESALRRLGNNGTEAADIDFRRNENLNLLDENTLAVPKQYFEKYKSQQQDKKIKLARIADNKCKNGLVVSATNIGNCANSLQIWGGGSFYSFRNKSNFNSRTQVWADMQFNGSQFIVGAETVQGIITNLGDVSIEDITLSSSDIKFLKEFKPGNQVSLFSSQKDTLKAGISENGVKYSTTAPMNLNSTYLLRTIAYRTKLDEPADNRTDIIVVFKIIGVENDGSLIILWKELDKKNSPRFKE